nr:MAG TPA: hypothetical protein [Caudoviricetes sp.]
MAFFSAWVDMVGLLLIKVNGWGMMCVPTSSVTHNLHIIPQNAPF